MRLKNKIKKYDFVNVIVVADFDGNSEFGIIWGMRVQRRWSGIKEFLRSRITQRLGRIDVFRRNGWVNVAEYSLRR